MIAMETLTLLEQLCQCYGVSGDEGEATATARKVCNKLGDCSVTPHGSLVCKIREAKPGQPHLMLNAHIDEIGMIVTAIDDKGFLKVAKCGGVDRRLLMASPVKVHTGKEVFHGVIGSIPPHLQTGDKKNPKIEEAYIDVGFTKKQAEEMIPLGSRVSFEGPFTKLEGGLVSSKALDDRCGCVAVILAAEQMKAAGGDYGLTLMLSTQEETGGPGAKTAAFASRPTECIVVDVTFGTTPEIEEHHCGKLKAGPMIGKGAILDRKLSNRLEQAAKEKQIPYQIEVMGSHTGTDADGIVTAAEGIPCASIGIPLRYMHTPVEVISVEDVENTVKLIAAYGETAYRQAKEKKEK